jgi:antitoxin component YwqK of YwqJK toxin-antitoxin module
MKSTITFLLALIIAAGCRDGGRYLNDAKWIMPGDPGYRPLKAAPQMVTEFSYREQEDTTLIQKQYLRFEIGFYPDGGVAYRKSYMDGKLVTTFEVRYTDDGIQSKTYLANAGSTDTLRTTSVPLGQGRFKIISMHRDHSVTASIAIYLADGKEQKVEYYRDSSTVGKPYEGVVYHYQGHHLIKADMFGSDGGDEEDFFYSRGNSPDSILFRKGGTVFKREIYRNNEQGDPLQYWLIAGKDTMVRSSYTYQYDVHGNWTRQRDFTIQKSDFPNALAPPQGSRTITEREFKY